jgi:hypothetical protein
VYKRQLKKERRRKLQHINSKKRFIIILNFIVDEKNLIKGICVFVQMYFGMSKLVLGFDPKYPLGIKASI